MHKETQTGQMRGTVPVYIILYFVLQNKKKKKKNLYFSVVEMEVKQHVVQALPTPTLVRQARQHV